MENLQKELFLSWEGIHLLFEMAKKLKHKEMASLMAVVKEDSDAFIDMIEKGISAKYASEIEVYIERIRQALLKAKPLIEAIAAKAREGSKEKKYEEEYSSIIDKIDIHLLRAETEMEKLKE